jgi:rRNA maturation endonuclease Nob1
MSKKIDSQVAQALMIAAGLEPLEPYKNAISDWQCKCLNCEQIVVSRYNRVQQGSGCPRCAATSAGIKIRLSEEAAVAKLREYALEPLEPYTKSDVKWKCRCVSCGDVVYPKLKNLQRGDGGCYKCGMKKAGLKNRLENEQAFQFAEKLGYMPLEPYRNALTKWKMRHSICNAIVYPKLNSLKSSTGKTNGCAVCSGHQVEVGLNDLLTTHPQIAKEAAGWDPTAVTAGANQKKKWNCTNGHSWKASVAQRTDGHGCPTCSLTGFDPNKPSYLYFLVHPSWDMYQIGITNNQDSRLRSHQRLGWKELEVRGPMDGHLTQQWETAILRMLKAKGADLSNKKIAGKFDGYSEAWSRSTFEVKSIKELMRLTEEFEG